MQEKITEILERMDTVTTNINSVEVRLLEIRKEHRDNECIRDLEKRFSDLWLDAYRLKEAFAKQVTV